MPLYEYIIVFLNLVLMSSYFKSESLKDNIFVLFFLMYVFCSCQVVALFEMTSNGFFKSYITHAEYRQLSIWGNHLYLVILVTLNLLKPLYLNYKAVGLQLPQFIYSSKQIDGLVTKFFIFVFFLQLMSLTLGLTDHHIAARTVLPFHLNGIIDEIRSNIASFVIAIYMYDCYAKNSKISKKVIVIYILYAFFEVLVRNSKGAFVLSFIPVVVLMGIMGKINRRSIFKVVLPLVLSLALLYPIVEAARGEEQITVSSMYSAAKNMKSVDMSENSSPYIRAFLTGVYYTKVVEEIKSNELSFDFSRVSMLILLRGGAAYMTRVIDGVPEEYHHSSGVTGLNDALLWGGNLLCYVVTAVLTLMAIWGDKSKLMRRKALYKIILFFFFYDRLIGITISLFINASIIPTLGSIFIKYIVVRYYYKKIY